MAVADQTDRSRRGRNIAFAVSCLLLLAGVVWTFRQDYPYEYWDAEKGVPLNSVNFSRMFWEQWLHRPLDSFKSRFGGFWGPLIREAPGIALVLLYVFALPTLLARTVLRTLSNKMGFVRCTVLVTLLLLMAAPHLRTVLRRTTDLKYIVSFPEYFFNFF